MASETKRLNKIIKPLGFEHRVHAGHAAIHRLADGEKVLTCSATASDGYWWRQVIRDLQKYGHIPRGRYW